MNSQRHRPSAIVIGAGLAGLTAAYRLKQAGWETRVLEQSDYPGGRAATIERQGYVIDTGATGVGDCYSEYMDLVDELGIRDKVVYASTITGTLKQGRVYELDGTKPFLSGFLSRLFSWPSKILMRRMFSDLRRMGCKMNFQDVSIGHEYDDESAEEYSKRRLNQELLDYFVDPILRALVTARAKYISRLELMNAIHGLFSTRIVATLGGIGFVPRVLASNLAVTYRATVNKVTEQKDGIEVDYVDETGSTRVCLADACVIATLLPQAETLYPPCSALVSPLARELHYAPGICVHLGYKMSTKSKALMVLLSAKEVPELTLIWLDHNKAPDRAPKGHSLLYFYYDDAVAEEAAKRPDDQLIEQCRTFAERVFPELAGELDMSCVSRWAKAVPLPTTGIYKRMYQVRQNLEAQRHNRVQLAGDYLSCVGQNTAVVYGNRAAENLVKSFQLNRPSAKPMKVA